MGPGPSSHGPPYGQLTPRVKELWTLFWFPNLGWGKQIFSFTLSAPLQAVGTPAQHSYLPCFSSKTFLPHLLELCKVPGCQCQRDLRQKSIYFSLQLLINMWTLITFPVFMTKYVSVFHLSLPETITRALIITIVIRPP